MDAYPRGELRACCRWRCLTTRPGHLWAGGTCTSYDNWQGAGLGLRLGQTFCRLLATPCLLAPSGASARALAVQAWCLNFCPPLFLPRAFAALCKSK